MRNEKKSIIPFRVFLFFCVCACSFPLVFASEFSTMILMHLLEFIGYFWGLEHDGTHIVVN